jgi:hypothetical protein
MVRMLQRPLSIAAVLVLAAVAAPMPAQARVSVDFNIGAGTNLNFGRGISCSEGARLIRNRGFRDVSRINCRGRDFTYEASRRGSRYRAVVRARDGRVVDYRRLARPVPPIGSVRPGQQRPVPPSDTCRVRPLRFTRPSEPPSPASR